jgi:hypothetical protein
MRFGTFYVVNNVFSNYQNKPPLYDYGATSSTSNPAGNSEARRGKGDRLRERGDDDPYMPDFQYNLGIYNL